MSIRTASEGHDGGLHGDHFNGRLRVLHIAQPTDGGVRRYVVDVCGDQLARGWQVTVACPEGPITTDLRARGIPWRSWPATRSAGLSTVGETLVVWRIIRSVTPEVVHLHSSKAGLAGRLALRALLCPTIFQPHGWSWYAATGTVQWLTIRWERLAARWSTVVVCVGHDELTAGLDAGLPARMHVIPNGVDRVRFSPAGEAEKHAARRELGIPPYTPLVVCAGRVTHQKGQDVLLTAWPTVRARCPSARLAIVGDGDLRAELRRTSRGAGIRFVSSTPDIRPWLAAADVVTVPSRWEGLPLIALEAAATGRAVVGTTVGGLSEIITRAMGCLVPPEDPMALAQALARRLTEPTLAAAEGRQALAIATRFDQQHTLEQLAQLTLAVAGTRRPTSFTDPPARPISPLTQSAPVHRPTTTDTDQSGMTRTHAIQQPILVNRGSIRALRTDGS